MIMKKVWIILYVILWNIHDQLTENIVECNAIDVNQDELEHMNFKEQEEYVKKLVYPMLTVCVFRLNRC